MNNILRIFLIVVFFTFLILFRSIASKIFYDPFIAFFINDYLHKPLPDFKPFKLGVHLFLRYSVNTLISLGIIGLVFKNKSYLKFAIQFYIFAFLFLLIAFFILVRVQTNYVPVFYIRRFIIHPVFVILLIPILYSQRLHAKE